MGRHRRYKPQKYALGQTLLTLRTQTKLTQIELATLIGVSKRSVINWEGNESYPKAGHLRRLIALFVARNAFTPGHEHAEAAELWDLAGQDAPQPLGPFDLAWFGQLLAARTVAETTAQRPATGGSARSSATEPHPADDRPPARGGRNVGVGLPFQATPFIGRGAELAEIARILGDPACRLLTLLGPGGIGKTRLALETAARQAGAFTDGVAFVALAGVGAPNRIVSAIGDTLNLSFAGQPDPTAYLLGSLHARHMLLVLDNFEHLLAGVDLIYDIIARAPRVTILITSRERLHLQAEWLFAVDGLAYPPIDPQGAVAPQHLADLAHYSAVQLFVQRAVQVQPGLPLPGSTLATVVRICQHVAGMPLAIELAAAAVRMLPIAEIERQIRSSMDVLATTLRDVPVRHRSLRAVFDHSWHLLHEPERALFSRLAVFRGGWTVAAAEAVCLEGERQQAKGKTQDGDTSLLPFTFSLLPLVVALVDKSLVRPGSAEARSSADRAGTNTTAAPRFFLLEPIREYALEQLAARGEAAALGHAHAIYYLALAEAVAVQWDSPAADAAIAQLDREYDNMRAALQWARDGGDPTIGLQLAGALRKFWQRRGYYSEGRVWLEELLALGEDTSDTVAMAARLLGMHTAAWLASDQHDYARATQLSEQSMALRHALKETEGQANLLLNAARQARAEGQYQRATRLFEDVLARHRAMGDRGSASAGGLGQSLYDLALVRREQGDFAGATALFEEGLELHREIGEREGIAQGLMGLGDVARDQGDAAQLRKYSEQSLAISRDLGIQWAIGFALNNLALAAYQEGDLTGASALAGQSVALFRGLQADGGVAEVLVTMGHIVRAQGDAAAAYAALTEALRLAQAIGPRLLVAAALEGLGGVVAPRGQAQLAARLLAAASALRAQMGTPVRPVDQPAVQYALAIARATLGADTFAALWSEAGELPLEQILSSIPRAASFSAGTAPFDRLPSGSTT